MKPSPFVFLIPGAALFLSAAALLAWRPASNVADLQTRVPGSDRTGTALANAQQRPLVATFVPGNARPADLPGSWPVDTPDQL